jgi:signal peptidase I
MDYLKKYFSRFKKGKYRNKTTWQKIWYFIWHEDSAESWIINIILAFIIIKYMVYPGLGFLLATSHPIVAVVSGSMHHGVNFDDYWQVGGSWYEQRGISKGEFREFPMHNGFDRGDIMILHGIDVEDAEEGDILVFIAHRTRPRPDPIIHRIVAKGKEGDAYTLQSKGDNYRTNSDSINSCDITGCLDETDIRDGQIIGKAFIRVPYLGYVKIFAVEFACLFSDFNFCIK